MKWDMQQLYHGFIVNNTPSPSGCALRIMGGYR